MLVLGKYTENIFYVGNTGRKMSTGNPVYALYLSIAGTDSEEISDAVADLQLSITGDLDLTKYNLLKLQLTMVAPVLVNGMLAKREVESIIWLREAYSS